MLIDSSYFLKFAKSLLSDPSGISGESFEILSKIFNENSTEESIDLLSKIFNSSGRFFIPEIFKKTGLWYIQGSESTPAEDFILISKGEISETTPILVSADIGMLRVNPVSKYIKHSDDPNCQFGFLRQDETKLLIVSKRKIQPDEELTIDKNSLPWIDLFNIVAGEKPETSEDSEET